jgi:hypothetical protein
LREGRGELLTIQLQKGTSLPSRISLEELLKGDEKAAEMFCKSMLKYRFAVLKCNESTRKSIMEYKANGTQFFNLPTETKQSFWYQLFRNDCTNLHVHSGKDKYEAPDGMIKRKVNKGYLVVDGVKEFLKLQISDPIESVPSQVQSSFKPLSTTFDSIAKVSFNSKRPFTLSQKCLESIAKYKCEDGKSFMDMKFYEQLVQKLDKSSISYIHYFAMKESSPDDTNNDSEYRVTDDQDKDKVNNATCSHRASLDLDWSDIVFV